ncbi:hypothetical protein F383_20969 [Gossypium arboreum]|uniref:Uncharacterized protein n=1 Tax=Gossypium arboreum TaxID=29729 RepID=A0A0B0P127_GOSAR|nr:hypothetical protein F383_20969 [Gossypium arboreum]
MKICVSTFQNGSDMYVKLMLIKCLK